MSQLPKKLDPGGSVMMPGVMIPGFRTALAIQRGVENKLLFRTWGGLGDQICAEPTLRYALKAFRTCEVSLASEIPAMFSHLAFKRVYNLKKETPDYPSYFTFETIVPTTHLTWEFFGHCITNCVDFPSLCSLRCTLAITDKEIFLKPARPTGALENFQAGSRDYVFIHAGRHWPSKTFPKDWWDRVIETIIRKDKTPVLIGANTDDNRGTVDVVTDGCVDLRSKTTPTECVWLLQHAKVLITNDSSPLHMAVSRNPDDPLSGRAWVGYIATCKHPDYITHWRYGEWSYRMKNFGQGGMWDVLDYCPNKENEVKVDSVEDGLLRSWLPDPEEYASWAVEKTSC